MLARGGHPFKFRNCTDPAAYNVVDQDHYALPLSHATLTAVYSYLLKNRGRFELASIPA